MRPKIFLRTLLYTTGPKGRVIENMYLSVRHDYGTFIFDFWGTPKAASSHSAAGATIVGRSKPEKLMELNFAVRNEQAAELVQIPTRELFLFWNACTRTYDGQVEIPPPV